jgi:hypothetical protein
MLALRTSPVSEASSEKLKGTPLLLHVFTTLPTSGEQGFEPAVGTHRVVRATP